MSETIDDLTIHPVSHRANRSSLHRIGIQRHGFDHIIRHSIS